jgi:hypothetical protein
MNEPTIEVKLPRGALAGTGVPASGGPGILTGAAFFGVAFFGAALRGAAFFAGAALRAVALRFAAVLRPAFLAADLRAPLRAIALFFFAVFAAARLREPTAFFRPRAFFFDLAAFAMIVLRCRVMP